MKVFIKIRSYNHRRYSTPWLTKVNAQGKITFDEKIAGCTCQNGSDGQLYFYDEPVENQVYAYGQKDYRGGNTKKLYCIYRDGEFLKVPPERLLEALQEPATYQAEPIQSWMQSWM